MHAVKRLARFTSPAATVVSIGAGGVGQIAVQLLKILTPARIVVVEIDPGRGAAPPTPRAGTPLGPAPPAGAPAGPGAARRGGGPAGGGPRGGRGGRPRPARRC